jgi:hypothetical protein
MAGRDHREEIVEAVEVVKIVKTFTVAHRDRYLV